MKDENPIMTRVRTSISLDKELLERVNKYVESNILFKDRSHFIEVMITEYFESLDKAGAWAEV